MTAVLDQKSKFIRELLLNNEKGDGLFDNFLEHFYKHTSMGYLLSIEEQSSKNVMLYVAKHAFKIFQNTPPKNSFYISLQLFEDQELQVLFLHCFNKPFIVRSVNVWLNTNKLNVGEFVHATFNPKRKGDEKHEESIIAIIIPKSAKLPDNYQYSLQELYQQLTLVLDDYLSMQQEIKRVSDNLLSQQQEHMQQAGNLLKWLENKHFALLGLRYFEASQQVTKRLGAFKLDEFNAYPEFSPQILKMREATENLHNHIMQIKKTNKRSDIYKSSRLDSVEILDIDSNGITVGIVQIIGLFTSNFYKTSPLDIPGLQSKVEKIYQHLGFSEQSHNGKILKRVINSIPLDEFYYIPIDDLNDLVARILNMYDRITAFARYNVVANAVSVLIYLPKYRYSESLRQELSKHLLKEFGGVITSTHASVGDASFAQLVYIINCKNFCNTK
jgi:glutamate dehydrogenase